MVVTQHALANGGGGGVIKMWSRHLIRSYIYMKGLIYSMHRICKNKSSVQSPGSNNRLSEIIALLLQQHTVKYNAHFGNLQRKIIGQYTFKNQIFIYSDIVFLNVTFIVDVAELK